MKFLAASLPIALLWSACAVGRGVEPPAVIGLSDLVGEYQGTLRIHGGGVVREVAMLLCIESMDDAPDRFRFLLGYGEDDRRDYLLVLDDPATGACRIDERNGIELAARWCDGELVSAFTVGGHALVTRYRVVPGGIDFALDTFAVTEGNPTGGGVTTQPRVVVQRAMLARR